MGGSRGGGERWEEEDMVSRFCGMTYLTDGLCGGVPFSNQVLS